MNAYVLLGIAIVAEVVATTFLKYCEGFTKLWYSIGALGMYAVAFYFLSQILGQVPTGVAYAIWAGGGIVLVSLIGWVVSGQKLDLPAIIGIGLICAGVVIINFLSKSVSH
ncbi:SMR family transporter [Serratia ureilytica]|uniref:SMR family transporter n=1 Tax=Serratia ureilytica TaxID=300181 RepID=UPI00313AB200